jgi:Transposase DDE domain
MHSIELLHKTFEEKLPSIHKNRLKSLMIACEAALIENKVYLTGLGRAILNTNKESSNIQKVDRLLGNGLLQAERDLFYTIMLSYVIQEDSHPWILVDWTCLNSTTNLYALRASVSMKGRSIVIYEECHPKKYENNHAVHKAFLNRLKTLMPSSSTPVIVTDAGFRAPWFAHVLKLNWHFVGRLRNKNLIFLEKESSWVLSSHYFEQATRMPTHLGQGLLTEEGKVPAQFVLYKGKAKGRHQLNKNKKKSSSGKSKVYSKAHKEPWLLATSLPQAQDKPLLITNIFRHRMRIEENIRDTKSPHYGFGLKDSITRSAQRMNILLLIAAIATLIAWLAGLITKYRGNAADFQAHSAKFTRALSLVFLGRRAIKKGLSMNQREFEFAINLLYQCAIQTQNEKPHYA